MLSRCAVWMFAAVLGSTACGGTEEEAPVPEAENEVRQSKYWAQCEVDAYGYQTGRCIDLNPYMYCAVHWQTCAVGARRPLSTNWNACGTRLNDIVCSGAVD